MAKSHFSLVLMVAFLLLVSLPAAAQNASISFPFKTSHSLLLVNVTLDGQPKVLVFDTGADRTFIRDKRNVGVHSTLVLGNKTLSNFLVAYVELDGSQLEMVHADGVLGQDVLGQFRHVHISYDTHTIELIPK